VGEAHVHLYGDDYLLEREGDVWLASVPCFCDAGAPAHPTDWHWHLVAQDSRFTGLLSLLAARKVIEEGAA
jgi:hypothetical protein